MNDGMLRIRARQKLLIGEIPCKAPAGVWGGTASNQVCAICDSAIRVSAEIEVDSADGRRRFYHVRCYQILLSVRGPFGGTTIA